MGSQEVQKGDAMKTVHITMDGGVIQHMDIPEGINVIVRDYDVEGSDYDTDNDDVVVKEDADGYKYIEVIYREQMSF